MVIEFFHPNTLNTLVYTSMKRSMGHFTVTFYQKNSNVLMECCAKHGIMFHWTTLKLYTMLFFHPTLSMDVKYGVKLLIHLIKKFLISKIEHFALFHLLISVLKARHFTKTSRSLSLGIITKQNSLFVHDSLKNASPKCFCDYFKQTKNTHSYQTKSANLGCLFVPPSITIRYGIYSITNKCISNWNAFTKAMQIDLLTLSRSSLKIKITQHLLESYL